MILFLLQFLTTCYFPADDSRRGLCEKVFFSSIRSVPFRTRLRGSRFALLFWVPADDSRRGLCEKVFFHQTAACLSGHGCVDLDSHCCFGSPQMTPEGVSAKRFFISSNRSVPFRTRLRGRRFALLFWVPADDSRRGLCEKVFLFHLTAACLSGHGCVDLDSHC